MSVYTELLRIGISDPEARALADAVQRTASETLATKADLHALESRIAWKLGGLIIGAMLGVTGMFATIVGWMVSR